MLIRNINRFLTKSLLVLLFIFCLLSCQEQAPEMGTSQSTIPAEHITVTIKPDSFQKAREQMVEKTIAWGVAPKNY